jgi:hypothetical protein
MGPLAKVIGRGRATRYPSIIGTQVVEPVEQT